MKKALFGQRLILMLKIQENTKYPNRKFLKDIIDNNALKCCNPDLKQFQSIMSLFLDVNNFFNFLLSNRTYISY